MKLTKLTALASAGIVLAGLAGTAMAQADMTPEEAIAARQAAMRTAGMTMRSAGSATGDDAIVAATTLNDIYAALPDYFPEGSDVGDTKALPAIWEDPDGFAAAVEAAQTASAAVLVAAEAGDMDAYGTALRTMGQTCGACHGTYRAR